MFCPSCGKEVPDGAGFCPGCGSKLTPRQLKPEQSGGTPAGKQSHEPKHSSGKRRIVPVIGAIVVALIAVILVILLNPFGAKEGGSAPEGTPEDGIETPQDQGSGSLESEESEQNTLDIPVATEWDPETGSISNEFVSLTGLEWELVDKSSLPSDLAEESGNIFQLGDLYRFTCTAENLTDSSTTSELVLSYSGVGEDEFGQTGVKQFLTDTVLYGAAGAISLAPKEERKATFFIVIPDSAEDITFQPSTLETETLQYHSYLPLDDSGLVVGDDGGAFELIVDGAGGSTLTVAADLTFTNTTDANLRTVTVSYHYAYDGVVTPEVFTWKWLNLAPGETVNSKQDLLNEVDDGAEETKWHRDGRFLGDIFDAEGLLDHLEVVPFQIEYS